MVPQKLIIYIYKLIVSLISTTRPRKYTVFVSRIKKTNGWLALKECIPFLFSGKDEKESKTTYEKLGKSY